MNVVFAFDDFRLIPARQLLLAGERPVRIGGRAFEILRILIEHSGEIVSTRELIDHVWPNTVVEESNLKVHIASLRRALGDTGTRQRYIATTVGRGYRFVGSVKRLDKNPPSHSPLHSAFPREHEPITFIELIL